MQAVPVQVEAEGRHVQTPLMFSYWPPEQCVGLVGLIATQLWLASLK
jgi:hypothetical protein